MPPGCRVIIHHTLGSKAVAARAPALHRRGSEAPRRLVCERLGRERDAEHLRAAACIISARAEAASRDRRSGGIAPQGSGLVFSSSAKGAGRAQAAQRAWRAASRAIPCVGGWDALRESTEKDNAMGEPPSVSNREKPPAGARLAKRPVSAMQPSFVTSTRRVRRKSSLDPDGWRKNDSGDAARERNCVKGCPVTVIMPSEIWVVDWMPNFVRRRPSSRTSTAATPSEAPEAAHRRRLANGGRARSRFTSVHTNIKATVGTKVPVLTLERACGAGRGGRRRGPARRTSARPASSPRCGTCTSHAGFRRASTRLVHRAPPFVNAWTRSSKSLPDHEWREDELRRRLPRGGASDGRLDVRRGRAHDLVAQGHGGPPRRRADAAHAAERPAQGASAGVQAAAVHRPMDNAASATSARCPSASSSSRAAARSRGSAARVLARSTASAECAGRAHATLIAQRRARRRRHRRGTETSMGAPPRRAARRGKRGRRPSGVHCAKF